jgi:hypothetical protein
LLLVRVGRHPRAGRWLWEDQLVTLDSVSVDPVVRVREAVHEQLGKEGWSILDDQPISLPHQRGLELALRRGSDLLGPSQAPCGIAIEARL